MVDKKLKKKIKAPNGRMVTVMKSKLGRKYILYKSKRTGKKVKKYLKLNKKSKFGNFKKIEEQAMKLGISIYTKNIFGIKTKKNINTLTKEIFEKKEKRKEKHRERKEQELKERQRELKERQRNENPRIAINQREHERLANLEYADFM